MKMRLGPKEKEILSRLKPGEWTPPSVYLGDYGNCPSGYTVNRLMHKKLAVMRYQTWTPEETMKNFHDKTRKPGRETAEYNAALMPTPEGEKIIKEMGLTHQTLNPCTANDDDCPF